ncbi:DUF4097 family beta strand repeat-containing protein [Actomonas aquatica]|uniref:DUF4097 family beta strand repeat-containing protein n=1 Tax=Actomonas aquatica TaxID=2866162 RepID=A0ABZ1CAL0_9BACT|nr:DUF4097 family beta strand repeat-containing protein [Opitutus sp. WL0086]WRQ88724.1 DUF4097 family beta strand repeat-containing protein [Opitutus sp. WL0086]
MSLMLSPVVTAAERFEAFSWEVGDMPMVKLHTFRGTIQVERSAPGRVSLIVHANEGNNETPDDWLKAIDVNGAAFGAGVSVSIKRSDWGVDIGVGDAPIRELAITLRVPPQCSLDLETDLGGIDVGNDITGHMRARVRDGDIFFGRVDGSVSAKSVRGSVTVSRTAGDLNVNCGFGEITVGTVLGNASLATKSGSIEFMKVQGSVLAEAENGNVTAQFSSDLQQPASLVADGGSVMMSIDEGTAFALKARASWGRVRSRYAFDEVLRGGDGKRRLEGVSNGGGVNLDVRSSGGDVVIKTMPKLENDWF